MEVIKSLDSHLIKSPHDIYIPNCEKNGFYKKKQVGLQKNTICEKSKIPFTYLD